MKPNIKYTPPVTVNTNFDESYQSALKHVNVTTEKYKKQYFVNLIDKKGSWLSYNGRQLGQGRDSARDNLKEDEALLTELIEKAKVAAKEAVDAS